MKNEKVVKLLLEIAELLDIKETSFRSRAFKKAALSLQAPGIDIAAIYKTDGLKGLEKIKGVGKSIAKDIEEFLRKDKISRLEELKKETAIKQVIAHFFESKGISLGELKTSAKKRKIVYSRYTKPAQQLLDLAGSLPRAKKAITIVALWANSRGLDYTIETIFKRWLELDKLKPKEIVKKPFYEGKPMIFSPVKKKWYVIADNGEWLEFADNLSKIEWK